MNISDYIFSDTEKEVIQGYVKDASRNGHIQVVKFFLDNGANPNSEENGYSALAMAGAYNHKEVVEVLLDAGADVNLKTRRGTPLGAVLHHGRMDIAKYLVENGAHVSDWISKTYGEKYNFLT